jgi:hypothetical protein
MPGRPQIHARVGPLPRMGCRHDDEARPMLKGFKNFLMRGDIVVVAVGLIIALALSTLIKAFTDNVINPIITRAQGGHSVGLG